MLGVMVATPRQLIDEFRRAAVQINK